MAFDNINQYADTFDLGYVQQSSYLRTTTPISGVAGRKIDLSVGPGQPSYNAYTGISLAATPLTNINANQGIYTGPATLEGQSKFLHTLTLDTTGNISGTYLLCDYLMYYPFVDLESTEIQTFNNTQTLPRYTTGQGVQCFVVTQTPTNGLNVNNLCTMTYTNSEGVTGRTTTFSMLGAPTLGVLLNAGNNSVSATSAQNSFFVPLANGDRGIRSIQSVIFDNPIGGFAVFVLCYSIANITQFNNLTQTERTFFSRTGRAPEIQNGAFLNFIASTSATAALGVVRSSLIFVWG